MEFKWKDVGSGINFERKDFERLLDDILSYKVQRVFITYKDRLSRIGFDLFKNLFNKFKCEIIVLNKSEKSVEKVLMRCIKYTFNKMPHWIKHKLFRNTLAKDELPCVLHYIKILALRFDDFKKFE